VPNWNTHGIMVTNQFSHITAFLCMKRQFSQTKSKKKQKIISIPLAVVLIMLFLDIKFPLLAKKHIL
jgi:hypothetical protein